MLGTCVAWPHSSFRRAVFALGTLLAAGPSVVSAQFLSEWTASSGLRPDQVNPPWTLFDDATPQDAALSAQFLTLSTSTDAHNMFYTHIDPTVDIETSGSFFMEFGVRFVSGTSSLAARAPILVTFTTAPGVGGVLHIGVDDVFFNAASVTRGNSAAVDTNDAFHTYRIDVAPSGTLLLSYDGSPLLTGNTFADNFGHTPEDRIVWGEGSTSTSGTSEWTSFRHNALAVPEPSAAAAGLLALTLPLLHRRRRS